MCTLLKASVYSIVLQQQIWNDSEEDRQLQQEQREQRERDGDEAGGYEDVSIG